VRISFFAATLISFSAPASSAPIWMKAGAGPDGQIFYFDMNSVEVRSGFRSSWSKVVRARAARNASKESWALRFYDCDAKTSAVKEVVAYTPAGRVAGVTTIPDIRLDFQPLVPGTFGEFAFNVSCDLNPRH
jgi:hypothetical protein